MQPTLTQGNMLATPTTATTPAQTQAAIGAGWTPTTTLNANDLNTVQPTQPFTPQTGSSAQNALGAHVTPAPVDQEMANRNAANDTLLSLTTGSGAYSEAADTLAQQTAAGIPANQAELDDVTNQIATTSTNYDNQIANAQTAGGEGTTAATANVNNLTRQKNNDLAILDIRKSVLTDNISRMNQTIDLKVKADTEANQNKIDGLKTYIQNIDADPQLKAQMTAQANAQQAKLDSVKTASADALKTAAQNGAPSSVLDAIGKASADPNATATSIYQSAGQYMQTKDNITPFAPVNGSGGDYVPIDTSTITDKNAPNSAWGGMSFNGLSNAAQHFLSTGTMPALGLGAKGQVQNQRMAIINYAGQIADDLGMTQPQVQAMYKANSASATQIIERMAKVDTISSSATTQFPRLADLADNVKALGITEADIQAGAAKAQSKFGSVDASNYIELIQTIRGDYAGLQSAMGGSSRGGVFFSQTADSAIPAGLTGAQYLGIMRTMQQSAVNVSKATQEEANNLIGVGTNNPTGEAGGGVPAAPTTAPTSGQTQQYNGATYKFDGTQWKKQ
jgi:hypothetical protein